MNTFAVLFVCAQACLVQSVFGQCGILGPAGCAPAAAVATPVFVTPSNYAPGGIDAYGYGTGLADLAYPGTLAGPYAGSLSAYPGALAGAYGIDSYGGIGEGNVAVAGELPVCGSTAVAGQVPIMGAVQFAGPVGSPYLI